MHHGAVPGAGRILSMIQALFAATV